MIIIYGSKLADAGGPFNHKYGAGVLSAAIFSLIIQSGGTILLVKSIEPENNLDDDFR